MKKQSAFTLIELMVVMAIIAILATAGLSAYTGYIKKARDTTRIADVNAINTIIQGSLSINGSPPADMTSVVTEANNGQMITDPLGSAAVCLTDAISDTLGACGYTYSLCDDGAGYLITAKLESKSNQEKYTETGGAPAGYHVGSCTLASGASGPATITVGINTWMATDLGGAGTFYQGMRVAPVTEADWSGGDAASWTGSGAGSGDPCTAAYPGFRLPTDQELQALSLDQIINTLGLSMNGFLHQNDGSASGLGSGYYWSSGGWSLLSFDLANMDMFDVGPPMGVSVRCIQN